MIDSFVLLLLKNGLGSLSNAEIQISWQLSLADGHRRLLHLFSFESGFERVQELLSPCRSTKKVLRCARFTAVRNCCDVAQVTHQYILLTSICGSHHVLERLLIGGLFGRLREEWLSCGPMLARVVESARILLIQPLIMARSRAEVYLFQGDLLVRPQVNILVPTRFHCLITMLVLVRRRGVLGSLLLCKSNKTKLRRHNGSHLPFSQSTNCLALVWE